MRATGMSAPITVKPALVWPLTTTATHPTPGWTTLRPFCSAPTARPSKHATGEPSAPAKAIVFVTAPATNTFELSGNVAPVAEIEIAPVPSEEIVAPPIFNVLPERYKSRHLLDDVPKSIALLLRGIMLEVIAPKSTAESLKLATVTIL